MDPENQEQLLSDTIHMVMSCLHHHQDEAVKSACRDFLNQFAYQEDENEDITTDDLPF